MVRRMHCFPQRSLANPLSSKSFPIWRDSWSCLRRHIIVLRRCPVHVGPEPPNLSIPHHGRGPARSCRSHRSLVMSTHYISPQFALTNIQRARSASAALSSKNAGQFHLRATSFISPRPKLRIQWWQRLASKKLAVHLYARINRSENRAE